MKKTFAAVVVLCSAIAFAQADKKPMDNKPADNKGQAVKAEMKADTKVTGDKAAVDANAAANAAANPMASWKAPKVTKEDKAGLDAFYKEMEAAMMKGDMAACGNMMAPKITMVTDGSKGGVSEVWTREQWVKTMSDMMKNMPKDMKMSMKHKYTFLSDNLAMVTHDVSSQMGKDKKSWKSGDVVMKGGDGKWQVVSSIEGGWGDMPMPGTGGTGTTK